MAVVDKNGLGPMTHIVEVSTGEGGTTVEAAAAALQLTHTVAGVSGNFMAIQGTAPVDLAGVSVVVTFE